MSFVDKRACWMQVNSCDPLLTQCHIPVITLSVLVLNYIKGKVFPYSLPSVGPGADPGVQAVSPQVT